MLDPDTDDSYVSECLVHYEKQKHFYCSYHKVNFCRECIKVSLRDEKCCVVDIFDINKLYQLHDNNRYKNTLIIRTRNRVQNKIKKEEFFIANS